MSQDHRLQLQRFELKYLIDEAITPYMRDFIRCHLELDEYGVGKPNLQYPVHSLYFDSDDLKTHEATVNGTKNRFKLRLRYYDDLPNTPVFFEVKARVDNCILKQRCGVRREAVPLVASGQLPEPGQLLSHEPRHQAAIERFIYLLHQINARPKLHNHYMREAWVSAHDNSVRVTFDRRVLVEPHFHTKPVVEMFQPVEVFPGWTILELKFTTRYPNWFREMVEQFNLMQFASAKYSGGVTVIGEHHFHDGEKTLDWEKRVPYALPCKAAPHQALAAVDD